MSSFVNNLLGAFRQAANMGTSKQDLPSTSKVMSDDIVPGDINIIGITAYKGEAKMDLMSKVTEFHIFESILSPVLYGHIQIADATNFQEDFIMDDVDTYIHIEFQTPSATLKPLSCLFKVNDIGNKEDNPSNGMKSYSIQLVSPEGIFCMARDMNGFKLNDTPKNLIERIMKEKVENHSKILSLRNQMGLDAKPLELHENKGIIGGGKLQLSVLPQNTWPFSTIHQLSLISNKSKEGYSLFTFFETCRGYVFDSIERLMENGKKLLDQDKSDAIFFYDHLRNQDNTAVKMRNIIAYNQVVAGGEAQAGAGGVVSDIYIYNAEKDVMEKATSEDTAKNTISELSGSQLSTSFDSATRKDFIASSEIDYLADVMNSRRQLLLRLVKYETQILIYGDTNLSVGDIIECEFPRSFGAEDKPEESKPSKDSGRYLITHLRHMVLNTDRPQHIISCNLMKAEPVRK